MKMIYRFLSFTLFLCLNQGVVHSADIQPIERTIGKLRISIDPRMELLNAIQLTANDPRVLRNTSYSKDILGYFKPFSSHEAVSLTDDMMNKYKFGDDAPVLLMLHSSGLPGLEQQITYTDYLKGRAGGGDHLEQYRKAIKDFARISDFEAFWNSKIPFYNRILDLTIAEMGGMDMAGALEDYYNEENDNYDIIIMPAFHGGVGPKITDNYGKETFYSCIAPTNMKDGIPYLDKGNLFFLVWHEFGHSFVNTVVDSYGDQLTTLDLYEPIKGFMMRQGYWTWHICVQEHIVRSVHIRLYEQYLSSQKAKELLDSELKQRFIYVTPLTEKLKDFEDQRNKNNITFSEFLPQLLPVFDSLQKVKYWEQCDLNFNGPIYGPLLDVKVAIIYPTDDKDIEGLEIAQGEAKQIFDFITRFKDGITLIADTEALNMDLSEYGILAYGTIESNLFLKRHAAAFPFKIKDQAIYADKKYTDKDLMLLTCVPNPLNPLKGMSVHTATSNRAIQGINQPFIDSDFPFMETDYILFFNREDVLNRGEYKKNASWTF